MFLPRTCLASFWSKVLIKWTRFAKMPESDRVDGGIIVPAHMHVLLYI